MFDGIKEFLGRRKEMYDKNSLRSILGTEVAVSSEMAQAQRLWRDMYESGQGLHLPMNME